MRLPTIGQDYWAFASGEERHGEAPETFWIPPESDRANLEVGAAAKLIFEIEVENGAGPVERVNERMWVVVSEVCPPFYVGRLTNSPTALSHADEFYLKVGAEVPFLARHVIDIDEPPPEFLEKFFSEGPANAWPRR